MKNVEGWELNKLKKPTCFYNSRKGRGYSISNHHHHHHHHLSLSLSLSLSFSLSASTRINGSVNNIKFISDLYNVVLYCMHIFTCTCIFRVIIKINFNTHDCVKLIFPKKAYVFLLINVLGYSECTFYNIFYATVKSIPSIIRIFTL